MNEAWDWVLAECAKYDAKFEETRLLCKKSMYRSLAERLGDSLQGHTGVRAAGCRWEMNRIQQSDHVKQKDTA